MIISDVDDTVAEVFKNSSSEIICELEELLLEGKVIFLISGQSITNIYNRVISFINRKLRNRVLVGHCNGSEVYGFNDLGELISKQFFSVYDLYKDKIDNMKWRYIVDCILNEFELIAFPFMDINEFKNVTNNNPHCIMLDDRMVQISLDFVNSLNIKDFRFKANINVESVEIDDIRVLICRKTKELFQIENIPIEPHLSGKFALDFNIKGVNKGLPIKHIFEVGKQYQIQLPQKILLSKYSEVEVWGDSFSISDGGSDHNMSLALPKETRSISFRDMDLGDTIMGYNIVTWNGKYRCHDGLLEYLKSRKNRRDR